MHSGIHQEALELAALLEPTWPTVSARIAKSGRPTCEVATASPLKDKLKKVEAEISSARDERAAAVKERDAAKDAFANSSDMSTSSDEFKAAQEAVAKVGSLEDKIADLQAVQVTTLRLLGESPSPQGSGHDRPSGDPRDPRAGWDSSGIFADERNREILVHASGSKQRIGGVQLGEVANRDALVADITGSTNMRRADYAGMVSQLRRVLRVLDLIPVGAMDQNSLPYTQEGGSFATAAETTEGTAKPEAAITFTDAVADAATIAHWQKVLKQSLADFPALQSIIDSRMRYGVQRRLEAEVLNGNGTTPNMRGILQTSGIGAVTYSAGALIADQVLKGITTVMLADAMATGIVMHPTDWQNALLAKAAGDGHYFSGGPFQVTPQQMWGVPLIPSATITQGSALVGDFEIGAQIFIREGVHVLLSDSDQDDFIKNRVTLLAEMRAALAVWRPAAFANVALQ